MVATGLASAAPGTIDEYWLQEPLACTSRAASGADIASVTSASGTACHIASASWSAAPVSRRETSGLDALASTSPLSPTSTALTFVVPTSTPIALAMSAHRRRGRAVQHRARRRDDDPACVAVALDAR